MSNVNTQQTKAVIIDERHKYLYLRRFLRERYRDSLSFVPAVFVVLALLLALIVRGIDTFLIQQAVAGSWVFGSTAALISVTSVISASMLTFVAVVFSVTLVALQLASQQFSPRVMSTVLRNSTIKFSLGIFVAAFVFSLVVLSQAVRREEEIVPLTSLTVSMILVFISLIMLFIFAKTLVNMIRVAYIIHIVAEETHASIAESLPFSESYGACAVVELGQPKQIITYTTPPPSRLVSRALQGVLIAVNEAYLMNLAHSNNCVIRILPRTGEYIVRDMAVAEVYGELELDTQKLLSAFAVGPERSLFQDPAFGFRELVDISILALSPGTAVPTTATQAIYRLTGLLLDIAKRPLPTSNYISHTGNICLIRPITSWATYVDLAFREIIEFSKLSSQARTQLEHAFDLLLTQLTSEFHPPLHLQQQRLQQVLETIYEGNTNE